MSIVTNKPLHREIQETQEQVFLLERAFFFQSKTSLASVGVALKLVYDYRQLYLDSLLALQSFRNKDAQPISVYSEMIVKIPGDPEQLTSNISNINARISETESELRALEDDTALKGDRGAYFLKKNNREKFLIAARSHRIGLERLLERIKSGEACNLPNMETLQRHWQAQRDKKALRKLVESLGTEKK